MKNQFSILFGIVAALGCVWSGVGLAGSSKSLADCAAMDNVFMRVGCYSEIAAAEGDPGICDQIKDHHLGHANCISQVALSKQDATICDRIDGDHPKALCIIKVGEITGDYSHCASIKQSYFRSACEAKGAATD